MLNSNLFHGVKAQDLKEHKVCTVKLWQRGMWWSIIHKCLRLHRVTGLGCSTERSTTAFLLKLAHIIIIFMSKYLQLQNKKWSIFSELIYSDYQANSVRLPYAVSVNPVHWLWREANHLTFTARSFARVPAVWSHVQIMPITHMLLFS